MAVSLSKANEAEFAITAICWAIHQFATIVMFNDALALRTCSFAVCIVDVLDFFPATLGEDNVHVIE